MVMQLNKPKSSGVTSSNPLVQVHKILPLNDGSGTAEIFIRFYEDQVALDEGREYHTSDYIIDLPVNFELQVNTALKLLPDFDQAV